MINVYGWMFEKNSGMFVALLSGEKVLLVANDDHSRDIYVSMVLDGEYALENRLNFEFWQDGKNIGSIDEELGGNVTGIDDRPSDPEIPTHVAVSDAIDEAFQLTELGKLKFELTQAIKKPLLDEILAMQVEALRENFADQTRSLPIHEVRSGLEAMKRNRAAVTPRDIDRDELISKLASISSEVYDPEKLKDVSDEELLKHFNSEFDSSGPVAIKRSLH